MQRLGRAAKHRRQASLLRTLPLALISAHDVDDVLQLIARNVMDALDYEDCIIYVVNNGRLVQRAAWGSKSPDGSRIVDPVILEIGEGIVGSAAQTRTTQLVADTGLDDRFVPGPDSGWSELAVPILFGNEVLGVVDTEHSDRGFFSEDDARVVETIAAIVAARLHSANSTHELHDTIRELNRTKTQLERSLETDALTGIGNRRQLNRRIDEAVREGRRIGICALDLDRFKEANDFYGHQHGDEILRRVAAILERIFDQPDMWATRVGGDEFVVLTARPAARFGLLVQWAATEIAAAIESFGCNRVVTASAGVAFGEGIQAWADADDALYAAKAEGGNTVRMFDAGDAQLVSIRNDRSARIRLQQWLSGDRLRLVAQAITPVADPHCRRDLYEVLLRVVDDDGESQAPGPLLELAQKVGCETEIDRWVLNQVLDALSDSPSGLRLAINWSVASLLSDSMTRYVITEIKRRKIDPDRLIVEVTEHAAIASPSAFRSAVQMFRSVGISVAIDDLGSGWTSLKMLKDNPVDYIKLDGSWVRDSLHDEMSRVAVKSMVDCALLVESSVIAEWIENDLTRLLMADMGVQFIQGWLVMRPQPLSEVLAGYSAGSSILG